jgi:hypothetical protein
MKSILILYTGDDWEVEKPRHSDAQAFGYKTWGELCNESNIKLTRASIQWFKDGKFMKYWEFDGDWIKVNEPILPTVVYDKSRNYDSETGVVLNDVIAKKKEINSIIPLLNTPEFSELLDNKLNQSLIFHQFMPKTVLVNRGYFKNEDGKKVVIKEFYGSGGKKVSFPDERQIEIKSTSLVQEFLDGKNEHGVLQDYRIVFIEDKPQYMLSRIAKENSLYTNFHQGAKVEFINLNEYTNIVNYALEISKTLEVFDRRIFSLDFLKERDTGKLYLIEINTMPGLDVFDEHSKQILIQYLRNLNNYLISQ